jgi:hypothetical protein
MMEFISEANSLCECGTLATETMKNNILPLVRVDVNIDEVLDN